MNSLTVGILGGGSWGTTVASLTARNAQTKIWARDPKTVSEINQSHTNSKYLPNAILTNSLAASETIKEAITNADVIVMAIPSSNFRGVLEKASEFIRPWVPIVSLTKGLEDGTKMRMTEIASKLNINKDTVSKWVNRFIEKGLEGLTDEPRLKAPRKIDD